MYFALAFGFFVFFTSIFAFVFIGKKQKHFNYLAVIAGLQAANFLLYFLPHEHFFAVILLCLLYGSFYWYGALFYAFCLGMFRINSTHLWLHLGLAGLFALLLSIVFASGVADQSLLDLLSVPLPLMMFSGYLAYLLIAFKRQCWPVLALRQFVISLLLLCLLTVVIHGFLLANLIDNIWRLIIPALFALTLYVFFVYVAFTVGDFKRLLMKTYRKQTLTQSMRQGIVKQVETYFLSQENFKNSDIKIADVASALEISEKQLSESINLEKGVSFQTLVNHYRLQYLTERLSNNHDQNLLDMALEAGFGSKAAFNRCFKAQYGMTPTEWIAQIKNSNTI